MIDETELPVIEFSEEEIAFSDLQDSKHENPFEHVESKEKYLAPLPFSNEQHENPSE